MTDFTRVLLADKVAWELFGLAARERLLYRFEPQDNVPIAKCGAVSQRALSLLVLFDKITVHDFSEGSYRIPDFKNEGIIEIIARGNPTQRVRPLRTHWKEGPLRNRRRPPRPFYVHFAYSKRNAH